MLEGKLLGVRPVLARMPDMPCVFGVMSVNTRRTDGVIFDPWDTLAVHIFGTSCNNILKF